MRHHTFAVFACVLIAATTGFAARAHAASITFNQYDWLADGGGYTAFNSEWGYAGVRFSAADTAMFVPDADGFHGFVNVYTETPGGELNWAVKNVPLRFSTGQELSERAGDGFHFNLGIDRGSAALSTLNYRISVNSAPLSSPGTVAGPFPSAAVSKQSILIGGESDSPGDSGSSGQAAPSFAQNYDGAGAANFFEPRVLARNSARPVTTSGSSSNVRVADEDIARVNERRNHCAPAAVARGIHALQRMNPAMNVTDNVAQTTAALAGAMGTTEANGTGTAAIVNGKNQYVAANRLQIATSTTLNPDVVLETLGRGGVAEIGVNWGRNAQGQSMGAHRAFVAEIEQTYDSNGALSGYRARVIDDPTQGDGVAANRSYWLTFRPDGSLVGHGTGGGIRNFIVESFIVPTPGAAALALAASLMAIRRRRAA